MYNNKFGAVNLAIETAERVTGILEEIRDGQYDVVEHRGQGGFMVKTRWSRDHHCHNVVFRKRIPARLWPYIKELLGVEPEKEERVQRPFWKGGKRFKCPHGHYGHVRISESEWSSGEIHLSAVGECECGIYFLGLVNLDKGTHIL